MNTVTVATMDDPDDVAPYLERGAEFPVVRENPDGITIETVQGDLVRGRVSEFAPHVYRFGAAASSPERPALVTFEQDINYNAAESA